MQIRKLIATTALAAAIAGAAGASDTPAQSAPEPVSGVAASAPPYLPETSADLAALLEGCNDDSCMSYVTGAIGGIAVYAYIAGNPSPFCTTGEVDKIEIRDAILAAIEETPALSEQHPAISILSAFGQRWPCVDTAAADGFDQEDDSLPPYKVLDLETVDALAASGRHALILGDPEADASRTILVLHDPNCPHCRDFRKETAELAERGWKVVVFPVATSAEESAGYGAVAIALRERFPEVARAIYDYGGPERKLDIGVATQIACDAGVSETDLLTLLAQTSAYADVTANTQAFFEFGAAGTPAWIIGGQLYSGQAAADRIEAAADTFDTGEDLFDDVELMEEAYVETPDARETAEGLESGAVASGTGDAGADAPGAEEASK